MSTAIKLTLPDNLAQQLQEYAKELGYTNIQEITLEALREKTIRLQALQTLKKHYQKTKTDYITQEERNQLMKTYTQEEQLKILKELNLRNS